jgi:hypothetical protein
MAGVQALVRHRPERISMTDKPTDCAFSRKPVETPEEALKIIAWAADASRKRGLHGVASELEVLGVYITAMHQASDTGGDDRDALIGKIADVLNIRKAIAHLKAGYPLDEDQRADVIRWLDRLQAKAHEGEG